MVIALIVTWVLLALIAVGAISKNANAVERISIQNDAIVRAFKVLKSDVDKTTAETDILKKQVRANSGATDACSADIDEIINKLSNIAEDIKRLDNLTTQVAQDEKEIRSYYVNFREPSIPVYGVTWADEYKTKEED